VVTARVLANAGSKGTGEAVDGTASIKDLAKILVHDDREIIPVTVDGAIIGGMDRAQALSVLLGTQ